MVTTLFESLANAVAVFLEASSVFVIAVGGLRSLYGVVRSLFDGALLTDRKRVWRDFASWLVLALEFELAADIIRTIVAPSWPDIGKLAAIAAIRTFLNYFLSRDIQDLQPVGPPVPPS